MRTSNRVLVIGLDGATWDVLDPWISQGILPNLARLRRSGSSGTLLSTIPPITAAAWSTFMTGKRPGKHGVFHFIKLFDGACSADSKPELVNASSIKSPTLWDVMGHHDRKVVLINIPLTYPPRPVNGVMITGLLTPSRAPIFTYPPELSKEITDYKIDLDRFMDMKPFQDDFGDEITAPTLSLVDEFRDMLEKRVRVTLSLMGSNPWDFFMVVFIGTDRLGHYLWPYHGPVRASDSPEKQQLCHAVRDYYVRLDEVVGELVERAGEDAAVVVMSDHGMGPPHQKQLHCNNWLYQRGWLSAKSGGASIANPDNWLKQLGLPRDKIGRIIRRIPGLAGTRLIRKAASSRSAVIDLDQSDAYCVPIFFNIMGIRLNLGGAQKADLYQAIVRGLEDIVDPETGLKVIEQVCRGEDYYNGPYAGNIPDIIVTANPTYGFNHHLSHYSSVVTKRLVASGPAKHRAQGIFIAQGPGILAGLESLPNLNIEDVAPTVLYLMGLPVPSDMDGRVLTEIVSPVLQRARPVRREGPVGFWPKEDEAVFDSEVMSAEDEELIRDRLQSLGYLE